MGLTVTVPVRSVCSGYDSNCAYLSVLRAVGLTVTVPVRSVCSGTVRLRECASGGCVPVRRGPGERRPDTAPPRAAGGQHSKDTAAGQLPGVQER